MAKIILASHGGLSKGMKDSVSMIVGDLAKDIETYSLLPGQNPEDFYQEVLKEAKECEEQILILCDIKGGSVHTAFINVQYEHGTSIRCSNERLEWKT